MKQTETVKLAVFDWAGTMVDYGCMAPAVVFKDTFEAKNIHLTKDEILKPMGMEKMDHIRTLLLMPQVTKQWEECYGRSWTEDDIQELYEAFEAQLAVIVADYSDPIPGVTDTVAQLRSMGVIIGSTTGYTGAMMEHVIPRAKAQGYEAEYVVTPEIVGAGRPSPFMVFENMRKFHVDSVKSVVKVGDTVMDMLEGSNAGVWSVGILEGSSEVGLTMEEMQTLPQAEIDSRKKKAEEAYIEAGADYVIDRITELPSLIEKINDRMKNLEA